MAEKRKKKAPEGTTSLRLDLPNKDYDDLTTWAEREMRSTRAQAHFVVAQAIQQWRERESVSSPRKER